MTGAASVSLAIAGSSLFHATCRIGWLRFRIQQFNGSNEQRDMKATWNGTTLAESNATVVVEGNHYFPIDSIKSEFFQPSQTHTVCGWKGTASYYDVVVNDATNKDAAWFYPETKSDAKNIEGYIAFWKGVQVKE